MPAFTPLAKALAAVGALIVVCLAAWWLVATLTGGKRAKVQAKLSGNVAGAALESGRDAVGTVGAQQAAEAASDRLGAENAASIHAAPGSDAKVDPGASSAGIKALCRRASAKGDPRCAKP